MDDRPSTGPAFAGSEEEIEVIVPAAACERLMERLEKDFFPKYAMVAYEADVRVRRPGKF